MSDSPDPQRPDGWSVPGYRHVRELGAGATGQVFQAAHDASGTPVAIKYLSARLRGDPDMIGRFRDEARLLEGLGTPHVVRLYEYVESAGGAAIVMELVEGVSLHTVLRERGATEPEAALALLKGSLLGLSAAHRLGVVHRDYKPANVLVDPVGCSKLVDFGIAVREGEGARSEGTPAYMAPEQWRGEPATPATDVYAATATFFECLTGDKPYPGSTLPELALQHVEAPVPEERVSEELRDLIRRGMAKSPADRPAGADAFISELEVAALAAHGEDWEERGRRRLVVLVAALLPLLWPGLAKTAPGGTDTAATALPPSGGFTSAPLAAARPRLGMWAGAVAGTAVLALGAAVTIAAVGGDDGGEPQNAAVASTAPGGPAPSSEPASGPASPPGSVSPSGAASASASAGADPSASGPADPDGPGDGGGPAGSGGGASGGGDGSADGGTGEDPPADPEDPGPEPGPTDPGVEVSFLGVGSPVTGRGQSASAVIMVETDTTGPVTVTVTWYDATENSGVDNPGLPDGAPLSITLQGRTSYQEQLPAHVFDGRVCTSRWGVLVSTSPSARQSRPWGSVAANRCPAVIG